MIRWVDDIGSVMGFLHPVKLSNWVPYFQVMNLLPFQARFPCVALCVVCVIRVKKAHITASGISHYGKPITVTIFISITVMFFDD